MILYIYNIKLATGRWSSPRIPVFHIIKSDLDDIAEILLKGALRAKPKPYNIK
jgi:hypothetical protein